MSLYGEDEFHIDEVRTRKDNAFGFRALGDSQQVDGLAVVGCRYGIACQHIECACGGLSRNLHFKPCQFITAEAIAGLDIQAQLGELVVETELHIRVGFGDAFHSTVCTIFAFTDHKVYGVLPGLVCQIDGIFTA